MILLLTILELFSCDESKVVVYEPEQQTGGSSDESTLQPQIQMVYPGTLQTLDIPYAFPTDILYNAAPIFIIFSNVMENDGGEMSNWLTLTRNGTPTGFSVSPATSSSFFEIIPSPAPIASALYHLSIPKIAHLDNLDDKILNFESLVVPPASTIDPPDSKVVTYVFQTGAIASADVTPPTVLLTNPVNGQINVAVTLPLTGGEIYIIFNDNENPMIDPTTVFNNSFELRIGGVSVGAGTYSFDNSDLNFKRYTFAPSLPLTASTNYTFVINPSAIPAANKIKDMSGNEVAETTISFTTL